MKKNEKSNWSNEFNFENEGAEGLKNFSLEIIKDSYEALNKFYQKENKKNKIAFKKGKPVWL